MAEDLPGAARARVELDAYRAALGRELRLACSLVSHRDLGFCVACTVEGAALELMCWRLLAIVERGVPLQPWEVPSDLPAPLSTE